MEGNKEIIEFLNEALTAEITAVNQYFAQSKLCQDWGWNRLFTKFREESIDEMHDAEKLIDRILLLEGMPNLQRISKVRVGHNVPEQLEFDRQLEADAVMRYRRGVKLAHEHGDAGTRDLIESILVAEEEHLDWIETQQRIISDIGVERYLQSQIGE